MSLKTRGAERSDEEAVAEEVMGARRRVKIFENYDKGWDLESQVNAWLEQNPNVEILEFFPVSIATSVALAIVKAANEVKLMGGGDYPSSGNLEERTKESTVAAVGIYYTER